MRYIDEYRDPNFARNIVSKIHSIATRTWRIMEICGGQTHTLIKYGIDELLEPTIELVHGPGCPVCVTPVEKIDRASAIAKMPDTILTTDGDMMRVPGSSGDLISARADGADVRMVYSPMDAVKIAKANPNRNVVFFAIGFETTAPANAMAVLLAEKLNIKNFYLLVSHVLVPPAVEVILSDPENELNGFIAPGHVCTVMGYREYEQLANKYRIPFVVAGFEPLDLLQGILMLLELMESNQHTVRNQYTRSVTREGNLIAQETIRKVFEVTDMKWRGIGLIPKSGLRLKPKYSEFDAEKKFEVLEVKTPESTVCIAGQILQGKKKPHECPAFGVECTPDNPLGAPMVSSEGACAAYYAFKYKETIRDGI